MQKLLDLPSRKDFFLEELERLRHSEGFRIEGYVIMPSHFHMLIGEPNNGSPSTVMQLLKQRTAAKFNRECGAPVGTKFWQARFHDFNVHSHEKRVEKIHYMHHNLVKAGLVDDSVKWKWSSCRFYRLNEIGPVTIEYSE